MFKVSFLFILFPFLCGVCRGFHKCEALRLVSVSSWWCCILDARRTLDLARANTALPHCAHTAHCSIQFKAQSLTYDPVPSRLWAFLWRGLPCRRVIQVLWPSSIPVQGFLPLVIISHLNSYSVMSPPYLAPRSPASDRAPSQSVYAYHLDVLYDEGLLAICLRQDRLKR